MGETGRTLRAAGAARRLFAYEGFPVVGRRAGGRPFRRNSDADVLSFRLLHDDDGAAWRRWFATAGLEGFDRAKHLYLNNFSLVMTATIRGQGVALSAPFYVAARLRSGRLRRIGRTPVARAAFIQWFEGEARSLLEGRL